MRRQSLALPFAARRAGLDPEQYLEEIPTLADLKLNFLMNCYGSMFTSEPGTPWRNEWWLPMTQSRKEAYARIIRSCRDHGHHILLCLPFPVGFAASPRPDQRFDLGQFYQHYAWAQSQGVRWFSVSLDDVSWERRSGDRRHATRPAGQRASSAGSAPRT